MDPVKQAAETLNQVFKEHQSSPILFLTSGGSAFKILDLIDENLLGANFTISVLDERFSSDPKISEHSSSSNNFLQLKETEFYKRAEKAGCKFFETIPESGDTPESMAERFAHQMKNWRTAHPDGRIIITQGMGEDGHTAGIMPYPENPELFEKLFIEGTNWVTGYDAGEKNQFPLRVTTRINFLKNQVDTSIFYVTGESKRLMIKRLMNKEGKINELPALVIREMKDVRVFTDIYPNL